MPAWFTGQGLFGAIAIVMRPIIVPLKLSRVGQKWLSNLPECMQEKWCTFDLSCNGTSYAYLQGEKILRITLSKTGTFTWLSPNQFSWTLICWEEQISSVEHWFAGKSSRTTKVLLILWLLIEMTCCFDYDYNQNAVQLCLCCQKHSIPAMQRLQTAMHCLVSWCISFAVVQMTHLYFECTVTCQSLCASCRAMAHWAIHYVTMACQVQQKQGKSLILAKRWKPRSALRPNLRLTPLHRCHATACFKDSFQVWLVEYYTLRHTCVHIGNNSILYMNSNT